MDTDRANWFSTETTLLHELRRLRPEAPRVPEISGYEDLVEIRRGGQGVVFSAVQKSTRRRVAIKVLLDSASGPAARRRFEREVDLVALLRHPRIVSVYDSGVTPDDRPYLVMEFVEGQSLDEHLKAHSWAGRPAVRAVVDLIARVAEAVEFAHQRGVIHRDLKPSNIRVDTAGEPRVLDFGLAKLHAGPQPDVTVSVSGQFIGSLAWASPEQASGGADVLDVRSDVYSLGVMLYHALCGTFPYRVEGPLREVLEQIASASPARPSRHADWLDDEIETITLKCLAKEPERRYQSAGELARDLRHYLAGEPVLAKGDSTWYTLRATVRRHRAGFTVAALACAGLVAGSIALALLYTRARDAADEKAAVAGFLRDMLADPNPTAGGRDVRVVDVADRAARRLEREPGISPGVAASLRATLADTYYALGRFDQAEAQRVLVVAHHQDAFGLRDPRTLKARCDLAMAQFKQGRLEEGERALHEVVAVAQELTPAERAALAARKALAEAAYVAGRLDDAETQFRLALKEHYQAPHAAPDNLPQIVGGLAIVLRNQTRLAEAEPLFAEALAVSKARLSPRSGAHVKLVNAYASYLHDRSQFEQAERMYLEAIDLAVAAGGDDHEDTIIARSNLALLHADRGRLDFSEPISSQVLQSARRAYGDRHPSTLTAINNHAKLLQNLGRLEAAEPLMRECIEGRLAVLGPDHLHTLIAQSNLANMLEARGLLDDAVALEKQVLDTKVRTLGDGNFTTLISLNNVGRMTSAQGNHATGLEYLQRGTRRADEVLTPTHWLSCVIRANAARCLMKLDKSAEAEPLLRSAHEGLKAAFGDADQRTKAAAASLAESLRALGRTEEAETIHSAAPPEAKQR